MRSMAELHELDLRNQEAHRAAHERRVAARRECGPSVSLEQPSPLNMVPSRASGEIRSRLAMTVRRFAVQELDQDGRAIGEQIIIESPLSPVVLAV